MAYQGGQEFDDRGPSDSHYADLERNIRSGNFDPLEALFNPDLVPFIDWERVNFRASFPTRSVHRMRSSWKVCKFCQESSLLWKQIDGKWKLVNSSGAVHLCPKFAKG